MAKSQKKIQWFFLFFHTLKQTNLHHKAIFPLVFRVSSVSLTHRGLGPSVLEPVSRSPPGPPWGLSSEWASVSLSCVDGPFWQCLWIEVCKIFCCIPGDRSLGKYLTLCYKHKTEKYCGTVNICHSPRPYTADRLVHNLAGL